MSFLLVSSHDLYEALMLIITAAQSQPPLMYCSNHTFTLRGPPSFIFRPISGGTFSVRAAGDAPSRVLMYFAYAALVAASSAARAASWDSCLIGGGRGEAAFFGVRGEVAVVA